jgi:hypothetical protein
MKMAKTPKEELGATSGDNKKKIGIISDCSKGNKMGSNTSAEDREPAGYRENEFFTPWGEHTPSQRPLEEIDATINTILDEVLSYTDPIPRVIPKPSGTLGERSFMPIERAPIGPFYIPPVSPIAKKPMMDEVKVPKELAELKSLEDLPDMGDCISKKTSPMQTMPSTPPAAPKEENDIAVIVPEKSSPPPAEEVRISPPETDQDPPAFVRGEARTVEVQEIPYQTIEIETILTSVMSNGTVSIVEMPGLISPILGPALDPPKEKIEPKEPKIATKTILPKVSMNKITTEVYMTPEVSFLIRIDADFFGFADTEKDAIAIVNSLAIHEVKRFEKPGMKVFRRDIDEGREVQIYTQSVGLLYNSKPSKEMIIKIFKVPKSIFVRPEEKEEEESKE